MAEPKPLAAGDMARILRIYLRIVQELPPDTEAGYLDGDGNVHFASDIGQKLRASRAAADLLARRRSSSEG